VLHALHCLYCAGGKAPAGASRLALTLDGSETEEQLAQINSVDAVVALLNIKVSVWSLCLLGLVGWECWQGCWGRVCQANSGDAVVAMLNFKVCGRFIVPKVRGWVISRCADGL
jgi:hypothetical protein